MLSGNAAVIGAETVDHSLQLRRHPIVIKGCGKYDHIRAQNGCPDFFIVIFLYAGSLIAAGNASGTRIYLKICQIKSLYAVSRLPGAPAESSLRLAAYIGRKHLSKSYWEVKHNGKNY